MKAEYKGSRPPPQKRPRTSGLSIFFIMLLVGGAAYVASGGTTPVDPNGPGGPPTLEPHFNKIDYGQQKVVFNDPQKDGADKNLQLKYFLVEGCSEKIAFYFVIDTSKSMAYDGKMEKEKTALRNLLNINRVGGKTVVGITTFSKDVGEKLQLSYLDGVQKEAQNAINKMTPVGWTRTRDGMALAKEKLQHAIDVEEFPGYKYVLILMTDGVPEIMPPRSCYVEVPEPATAPLLRCFAKQQDPTVPSDITEQIKEMGVEIYSINIYSTRFPSDVALYPNLRSLLRKIASPPVEDHYFESIEGNNLDKILTKICDPVANY